MFSLSLSLSLSLFSLARVSSRFSDKQLQRPDNFYLLMGTVGQFYDQLGRKDAPLITQKDSTLSKG